MPSWFTHLATATELMKKLDVDDKNAFLIGSLMPDAERYVVKDFSIRVPYCDSHFSSYQDVCGTQEILPDVDKFLYYYKNKLNNPAVLGYLVHLLTDFYWNNLTYARYTLRDENKGFIGIRLNDGTKINCERFERSKTKFVDFAIFEESFIKSGNYILPHFNDGLIKKTSVIKEVPYNSEDIKKMITFCENKSKKYEDFGVYKLFTEDEIEKDYKNSIEFILNFLKQINT